jgi:hypothetical protein
VRRRWMTKLWVLPALLLVLSMLGLGGYSQLEDLTASHRQYQALSKFYGLEYAEMIKVIGPPDIDDGVKGIIEWHSLGAENLAFDIHYSSEENRRKPYGITALFPTSYGHKRCHVSEPPDEGYLAFLLYYYLQCTAVVKTPDELQRRDERYRAKLAKLAAITSS